MSNIPSLCLKCVHREYCTLFNRDPEADVIDCGRFIMKDVDKAIMQAMYEHFNVPIDIPEVKEKLDRSDFLRKRFNIPMEKED